MKMLLQLILVVSLALSSFSQPILPGAVDVDIVKDFDVDENFEEMTLDNLKTVTNSSESASEDWDTNTINEEDIEEEISKGDQRSGPIAAWQVIVIIGGLTLALAVIAVLLLCVITKACKRRGQRKKIAKLQENQPAVNIVKNT